jgi:hypothetical protein
MEGKYPSDLSVGEETDIPTEGTEDFEIVSGPEWVDEGVISVGIKSDGKVYTEKYEHESTERVE